METSLSENMVLIVFFNPLELLNFILVPGCLKGLEILEPKLLHHNYDLFDMATG